MLGVKLVFDKNVFLLILFRKFMPVALKVIRIRSKLDKIYISK